MGDHWMMAVALHTRGRLAWARGEAEEAERAYQQSWQVSLRERSQLGMVECLEGLIALSAAADPARGARLYGITATWRARMQTPLPPVETPPLEQAVAAIRATLGEARFAQALADGQATALEEALPS
jgi:hypothetical protein